MKTVLLLAIFSLAYSTTSLANFSISEFSKWEQLKECGIDLQFHLVDPNSKRLEYYSFTIQTPVVDENLPGMILTRIDYWKGDEGTVIPIHSREFGSGMRIVSFQISTADLKNATVVLRFNKPNSSSEVGRRLHLKELIDTKHDQAARHNPFGGVTESLGEDAETRTSQSRQASPAPSRKSLERLIPNPDSK